MQKTLFYLIILLVLYSCNDTTNPESKNKQQPATQELTDIEIEEIALKKKNKEFLKAMKKKNFVFSHDGCEQGMVGEDDLKTYGGKGAYNINITQSDSNLLVDFSFISSCCLDFIGDINKKSDTLKLEYSNNSIFPCDCSCIYCCYFDVEIKGVEYSTITLNGEIIN